MTLLQTRLPAFQSRDFRFYFCSRFLVQLSTLMVDVAVGWLIYDITGSALALGFIGLAMFVPNIAFLLVAGHVADRFDRRRVLVVAYSVTTLASAGLFLTAWRGATAAPIFALVTLIGAARAFASPAASALVPNLVPKEHFAGAVATNSSAYQTATIIGPAMGGLIYIWGPTAVFATTTVCFACCVALLAAIRARQAKSAREPVSWAYLTAGIRFIRGNQLVLGLISLDLFAVLLGGATALLPIFAKDIFQAGPLGLGLLRSAPAVGAVVTALLLAWFSLNRRVGLRMFQSVAAFGLATIGFALSPSIWTALPCLVILGAADMVSVYIRSTLVQLETPDEMRGRVSAVNSMFIGASNELGQFESGVLAAIMGPVGAALFGGFGALGVTALWMRLFPDLRRRDSLTSG
ncbi:MAG TPA: MFS transporter [Beijerinckiaceae bacterium]